MIEFLSNVISHTPFWVWLLLCGLLTIGVRALSPYSTSRSRVLVLPIVLAAIGVVSAGRQGVGLIVWVVSLLLALVVSGHWRASAPRVHYDTMTDRIHFGGSVGPLLLMLTVFVCSYTLQVLFALKPDLRQSLAWQVVPAMAFGGLTGGLFARRWQLFRLKKTYSIGRASLGSG